MQFIDLKEQYRRYQAEIDARLRAVFDHGQFILGPEIAELEQALADYVGVPHCITVASGTMSLEIALRALEIGPGDEVITVPFTWISTAEVISLVGAKPVFVDIEPRYFNLDIDRLEQAISPRTKAILPVSLFGQMPDYQRINAIAARHGLPVIEDGAQSFGATQQMPESPNQEPARPENSRPHPAAPARRSCGVTRIGSTSFFPAKPLGCYGEGGALFTTDDVLADKMRAIRTHGGLKRHHHPLIGTNGRFDTLQAAVLLAKLPHFQQEIQERIRLGARYTELLKSAGRQAQEPAQTPDSDPRLPTSGLCPPAVMPGNTHVYAQYTLRVPGRDAVAAQLKTAGIPTAIHYPTCLHEQPAFACLRHQPGDFPESERASREVLSLPMHPFLTESDQVRIVSVLLEN